MVNKFWIVWNPMGHNPTHRHCDEGSAAREAERLAGSNPGQQFFVLEGLSVSQYRMVTTVRLEQPGHIGDEIAF